MNKLPDPFSFGPGFNPFDQLKNLSAVGAGFPHYNVRKIDDDHYVLEFALAGFGTNEIDLQLEGDTLTIAGSVSQKVDESNYLVKGIAQRNFQRKFSLSDNVVVSNAEYLNGLLRVYLDYFVPEEKKARKINIKTPEDEKPSLDTPKAW
jgi:molecular chaperone IbpA